MVIKKVKKLRDDTLYRYKDHYHFSVTRDGSLDFTVDGMGTVVLHPEDVIEDEVEKFIDKLIGGGEQKKPKQKVMALRKEEWQVLEKFAAENDDFDRAREFKRMADKYK